jgi:hypothetical protein
LDRHSFIICFANHLVVLLYKNSTYPLLMENFANKVSSYLLEIRELLVSKNLKYGNSALEPLGVFSQLSAKEGLLVRIDDKLKRIKNGSLEKDDEDVINDLVGYLVLLKIQTLEEKYKRNRENRLKNRIANED